MTGVPLVLLVWLCYGGLALLVWLVIVALIDDRRAARRRRQALSDARATRAMALGDLVMPRHGDYISDRTRTQAIPLRCGFCDDLSVLGDPGECACPRPCGRSWCSALRRQVRP